VSVTEREIRQHAAAITLPIVRAMVEDAAAHGYGPAHRDASSVLGIYADPASIEGVELDQGGVTVHVVPCVSALAVREALLTRDPDAWLVIVTDRPQEDLGVGLLAHLVGHKLRTPDPWEAVRQQFAATGLEPSLYADPSGRDLAHGLLIARPDEGWPPAPAGTLTREHALTSVARHWLEVPRRSLDSLVVLQWTALPGLAGRIADLRSLAGDGLTDATLAWVCQSAGAAGEPLRHLLRRGEIKDALPLGLVVGLLVGDAPSAGSSSSQDLHARELALARLAHRWQGQPPSRVSLQALGVAASQVMRDLLRDRAQRDRALKLLTRADALLAEAGASELAIASDVLPSGLTARLRDVAHDLVSAFQHQGVANSRPSREHTQRLERGWTLVESHLLAQPETGLREDPRISPLRAGVRLSRWLALEDPAPTDLAALALRHSASDAWVDAAVNDAHGGVEDPHLAEGLRAVTTAVRLVRDEHDRQFATALAAATKDDAGVDQGFVSAPDGERVWLLENLLPGVVIPLAKRTPTMLMVLDGMSVGVATEIVADILDSRQGWQEALLPDSHRRAAALAMLPTLTEVSRASLLSGKPTTGGMDRERAGYRALVDAYGLGHSGLFHKKPLDTSRPGYAIADDVAHAIADLDQALVTCVLNTIDDALDRSDPAGTSWTADAVKHLRPLLASALAAGRTVVLTADHGHVVERREGVMKPHKGMSSGRSRPATPPPGEDEVLVAGSRVLLHDGQAVLPVTERLRYGPLKAGYHGGATPAEVVVPVIVLIPGVDVPEGSGLRLAPPQEPLWWTVAPAMDSTIEVPVPAARPSRTTQPPAQEGTLFEVSEVVEPTPHPLSRSVAIGEVVTASSMFAQQRAISGRIALEDAQVSAAVEALAAAPGTRLPYASLAGVLGVPATTIRGAVAQLQQLLNVESYPVLRSEGATVILDLPLLREQFGIGDVG